MIKVEVCDDKMARKAIRVIVFCVLYLVLCAKFQLVSSNDSDSVLQDLVTNEDVQWNFKLKEAGNVQVIESESVKSRKKGGVNREKHHNNHNRQLQNRRSRGHRQKSNKDGKTAISLLYGH